MSRRGADEPLVDLEREGRLSGPILEEMLELALRRLRPSLSTRVGADIPVRVVDLQAMQLQDFLRTDLATRTALWCSYPVAGSKDAIVVGLEGQLVLLLVARMFGESNGSAGLWYPRTPTRVERAVGTRLARELVDALVSCWHKAPAPRISDGPVGPSPRAVEQVSGGLPMLCATLEISHEDNSGRIAVLVPVSLVMGSSRGVPRERERSMHLERVFPVEIQLVVELARLTMPLGELKALEPGMELPLGAIHLVEARVDGVPTFVGEPGESRGQRSFRIAQRMTPNPLRADPQG